MALTPITWFVFFAVAGYVTCNYPAPTNVKSTYLPDDRVIRVSWTDHPDHPSDSYHLLITRSSRYQWMISVSRRTYDLPFPVVYTGSTYAFVLFGYNRNLGLSSELTDSIHFLIPSSMPGYVKVAYTSSRAVNVSWMAESSSYVKQYVVVFRSNTTVFKETVPAASTSLVTRSLTYNTTYRIHVYTVLSDGTFGASSEEHPFKPVIDDESTIKTTQMIPISDSTEKEYNIRLVDGGERWRGRLEVFHHGQWGTVCGDGFDSKEALAVCRQLGYNSSLKKPKAYHGAYFGKGRGPIFLDDVNCPPESSYAHFRQCGSNGWGTHNCLHGEDVSVNCYHDSKPNAVVHAEFIRLQGGNHPWMGRLEVYHAGRWGTVCGDGFSTAEAVAVCNQMGIKISERDPVLYPGSLGSNRPIWLDDVTCPRKYPHLILRQCNSSAWGEHNCGHSQDVYVNCLPDNSTGIQEVRQLRLIDGGKPWRGRLEVYYYGQWGTVCDDGFGNNEALTVCRQLGYTSYRSNPEAYPEAVYSRGSGVIWLNNVDCPDISDHLQQCTSDPWGTHNCQHSEDVSVNCFQEEEEYNIRLVSGGKPWRGRLEVFHGGIWGTVCSDDFGTSEAIATCNQLGYKTSDRGPEAYPRAGYGAGSGPIWLDDVACPDEADNLQQCTSRGWGVHNCYHGKDVSVNCVQEEEEYNIRLVSGGKPWRGRLEVFHGGIWGTVCNDNFGTSEAIATCNQLGYKTTHRDPDVYSSAVYGAGSCQIWLDDVACPDEADNPYLKQCTSIGWGVHNCIHSEDVSVNCVQVEPIISQSPPYAVLGHSLILTCNTNNYLFWDAYDWKVNGSAIYSNHKYVRNGSELLIHSLDLSDRTNNYSCVGREYNGSISDPAYHSLDIVYEPLITRAEYSINGGGSHILREGTSIQVNENDHLLLTMETNANSAASVKLFKEQSKTEGINTTLLNVVYHQIQCQQTGIYTFEAMNRYIARPLRRQFSVNVHCTPREHSPEPTRDFVKKLDEIVTLSATVISNPAPTVMWNRNVQTIPVVKYNEYTYRVGGRVHINGKHDYGVYAATVKNGEGESIIEFHINPDDELSITRAEYSVNGGGSNILQVGTSIQVNENDDLLLTMESDANPAASLKLYKEQSEIYSSNTTLLNVTYHKVQCQQTGKYTFEAIHQFNIDRPLRRQFTVDVHCMPREHNLKSTKEFVKKLDETVTLSETVISYPEPTVTWSRHVQASSVTKNNEYTYRFSGNVHITGEQDYGVYAATLTNGRGETIIEFHISPDDELSITRAEYSVNGGGRNILQVGTSIQVNENDDLLLTMESDANPAASLKLYKEQSEIYSSNTTLLNVTYHKVQCQQTGKYTFEAIHQFNIDRPLRRQFTVDVHCMPREHNLKSTKEFVKKLDETVTLSETVISYPEPTVTWSRHVQASSVTKNNEYTYRFSGNVHITGEQDYGVYAATLTNGQGETIIEFHISPDDELSITRAEYSVNGGGRNILQVGTSIQVNENDDLLLTMETDAIPAASLKLYKEQSEIYSSNTTLLNVTYHKVQCQQTGKYTFEAIHQFNIDRPLRRQFTVDVHCMPREHNLKSTKEFVKKLDETVTLSETVISYPEPTVTWSRHVQASSVTKNNEYTYRFSGNVHITGEQDYGVYAATLTNGQGETIIEFHISPDDKLSITRAEYSVNGGGRNILQVGTSIQVNENDDLLLTMESDAIPAASLKLYKEQNEICSSNTTLLNVTYHKVQCQQTGKYTFEAIHEFNIDRPLRRQFTVDVQCMPRKHNLNSTREFVKKLDETVTLSEIVISYPEPTVNWSRHVQASSVAKYNEYTYSFSGNVHITGEKDYGVYVATVKNDKGELRIKYLIRPDENSPFNMILIIVSTTSGLVICACVFIIICVCKRRKGRQATRNDRDNQYDFSQANRNPEQASGSGIEMDEQNYQALDNTTRNRPNIYDVVN